MYSLTEMKLLTSISVYQNVFCIKNTIEWKISEVKNPSFMEKSLQMNFPVTLWKMSNAAFSYPASSLKLRNSWYSRVGNKEIHDHNRITLLLTTVVTMDFFTSDCYCDHGFLYFCLLLWLWISLRLTTIVAMDFPILDWQSKSNTLCLVPPYNTPHYQLPEDRVPAIWHWDILGLMKSGIGCRNNSMNL